MGNQISSRKQPCIIKNALRVLLIQSTLFIHLIVYQKPNK